ncbi:hypothetical protein G7046_g4777 [Stylonectria norvegica]|nr:hypothetical protein G7046_g4777 [Stylonectria norvegica]
MSKSWKSTLRLPRSSFPARPSPKLLQQHLRQCTDDLYDWQTQNRPEKDTFTLHDGPPYANGNLHVGHALNKVLKDMILRVKIQQGRRVVYRPGWDCHGLPIEMKALGSSSTKGLNPVQIRDIARRLASKTVKDQMKGFQSIGVMANWEKRWTTMDREFEMRQLRVFQNLVRRGLIYRSHKPVYWSVSSRTALAEAELEYREDHVSTAAYVKFPIVSDWTSVPGLSQLQGPLYAAIWTTTPWTLPANKAIAIHDDLTYCVIRAGSDNLLVATSRLEAMKQMIPSFDVAVSTLPGSELKGLFYRNKLRGKASPLQPIVHADFVTADSGTGLVHMAPGHGQDDYETCKKLGIEAFAPIDDGGIFTKEAYPDDPEKLTSAPSILDGGSQAVLDLMADDVVGTHKLRHKYPYDWRTKRPVVTRATAQWFADVGNIKDDALAALKDVRFIPEGGRVRLESFIKGRSEWCISRQRSWGVPIPALYDEAGNAVMTEESIEHIISVMHERTSSAWFSDSPDDPAWVLPSLTGKYRRGTDTMDVWFDSGSSWTETSQQADVYLEGSDQHRGWFQSSLLTYVATHKSDDTNAPKPVAPFRTLITHGFTLDSQGKKMSKSLGNIISPDQVMDGSLLGPMKGKGKDNGKSFDGLGPDAIRLWAASADYTTDVLIGQTILQPVQSALIKYRTIIKMLLGSLNQQARQSPLTKLDQIALVQLTDTMAQVADAYDNYEFHRATSLINRWVATDLSAFYLEALKDRLYCGDGGGILEPIFTGLLRMLAPITPLLVEEGWSHRPTWMSEDANLENPARQLYNSPLVDAARLTLPQDIVREDVAIISAVHNAVKATLEQARGDKVLGSSLQSSVSLFVEKGETATVLERYLDELDTIFVVSSVEINGNLPDAPAWSYVQEFEVQGTQLKHVDAEPGAFVACDRDRLRAMTDPRAASSQGGIGGYGRRDGPVTPERRSRFSFDTQMGEPSTIGAMLSAPTSPERPLAFSDDELLPRFTNKPRDHSSRPAVRERRYERRYRGTQKPQSSSGFLLQEAGAVAGEEVQDPRRRQPRYMSQNKGKDLLDPLSASLPRDNALGFTARGALRPRIVSPDSSAEDLLVRKRDGFTQGGPKRHPSQQPSSALDVDSTQIVNMALNLSESRRIASRRNITRTNPPRLAPVVDQAPASNLKAHLQQQRKTSRAISPMPIQAMSPRLSGVRSSSPLRPPFDQSHDNPYRYHFSTSTLSRAQKAKEHLELMAQYRRLLELLPPLKLGYDRPSATSPPSSPINGKTSMSGTPDSLLSLGREYNPLQYIRNRKVRARERRAIDGEKQGFSDVESVKQWVASAGQRASSVNLFSDDSCPLPPFPAAEEAEALVASDPVLKAGRRGRRPRVDWFFEPCDMVADTYWLEQDHHKQLIEDRNWCKVFPQTTDLSRPMSRQTDDGGAGTTPYMIKTNEDTEGMTDPKEFKLLRPDTDNSQGSSARERAKQKLHDIGPFHRHTPSSHNHHDFLRRKHSDSSLSGSENEATDEGKLRRSRHGRAGTLSSNTNDLLQKQMLEMIAQEAKEQQHPHTPENGTDGVRQKSFTPDRHHHSNSTTRGKESTTDFSDSDHRSIRDKPQVQLGPRHLDREDILVADRKRESFDIDSPQPMSPEVTAAQDNLFAVNTNLDLSAPSSRSSSPSRNPFSKVKRIFRDKSREEDVDPKPDETDEAEGRLSMSEPLSPVTSNTLQERGSSISRQATEGHKYNRSTGSARLRGDDQVGLRGMFKGPRIDTVIRGGVSRLGEMLWKKDSSVEPPTEALSADESDGEPARGRARLSLSLSRTNSRRNRKETPPTTKHFLDTMPQFLTVSETQNSAANNEQKSGSDLTRPQSRQAARFDLLKPPKLDVQTVPGSTSAPAFKETRFAEPEELEPEPLEISVDDEPHTEKKLDPKIVTPKFDDRDRSNGRHWSITDRKSDQRAQLSKREIARLRALILTSGIKAMEISRRAQAPEKRPSKDDAAAFPGASTRSNFFGDPWGDIAKKGLEVSPPSDQTWQASADRFASQTGPHLERRIWGVRSRIAHDLSGMTAEAADEADETSRDLALGQRLKVKHVVDVIDKMMRNRRRRFRWVRRGMWLAVEWVLVGFMWYVWFVVMLFRIAAGLGQGVWGGVKWLLWLDNDE